MSNVKKTLQMTSLLFGLVILFCYIGWSLGYDGFVIIGHIEMPGWMADWIARALLLINLSLWGGYVLDIYSWKILYISTPLVAASAIGHNFLPAVLFTGPIPSLVFLIVGLARKHGKTSAMRLVVTNILILVYQFLATSFCEIDMSVYISVYQALRFSINNILLHLLFYSIGGEKYYGRRLEQLVCPGRGRNERLRDGSREADSEDSRDVPVDKFEKWVMRSVIGVVQVIQWMIILWVCSLDNLFLDALVITTSFICHGKIISQRKHLKPIVLCTLFATSMFYFAARFTISFRYSQFFPIVVGLALTYALYQISYQLSEHDREKQKAELYRIKKLEEQINIAWDHLEDLY